MKRLAIYLAVTFGLTWGVIIPAGVALGAFEYGETAVPAMVGIIGLSMFFPLVGAIVANLICKRDGSFSSSDGSLSTGDGSFCKRDGGFDLCWKPRIRGNVRRYLAAWLGTIAVAATGTALYFALNPQLFDPSLQSYIASLAASTGLPVDQLTATMPQGPAMLAGIIAFSVVFAPFINMIPAFGEELGWRGMLFPALAERTSPRIAALISGAIWGLWHAPVIAMGHNYGMGYDGFPVAGILTMIVACTALGMFLSYLRMRSGSVWPCALAHGAFNAVANIGLLFCVTGQSLFGPSPLALVAGIPVLVLGIVCWLRLPRVA